MRTIACLEKKIDILKLPDDIFNKLKDNNILIVKDLWQLKRSELKKMNFQNEEINVIIIQLQLLGLDLNKKKY